MKEILLLIVIAVLSTVVIAQGIVIYFLIKNRRNYARKIKRQNTDKAVARREKGYLEKISNLYSEVERLEGQLSFYKNEVTKWKQKASEYAYAMQDIVALYSKACETISNYLREGYLIRNISDSQSGYEHFKTTWRDLQNRRFIDTYKFNEILDDPDELEFLFGTSDMNYLAEVFQMQ